MRVGVNEYAKRQVACSPFGHFDGTWEELVELLTPLLPPDEVLSDTVILEIPLDKLERFYTPIVRLKDGDIIVSHFSPKRAGEIPRKTTPLVYNRSKSPAGFANVILYSHSALGMEASTDADYEVVTINTGLDADAPMSPWTLMANHFGFSVCQDNFTDAQFVAKLRASCIYWGDKGFVDTRDQYLEIVHH
jgi:hypothetical protein